MGGPPSQGIAKAAEDGDLILLEQYLSDPAQSVDEQCGRDGETALQRAICRNEVACVKRLVKAGADLHLGRLRDGETAAQMMKGEHVRAVHC